MRSSPLAPGDSDTKEIIIFYDVRKRRVHIPTITGPTPDFRPDDLLHDPIL
jgi:hypothetical protein